MQPFLKTVATDLYERCGKDLHGTAVIFPNKRQINFFRHYLSQVIDKPLWAPSFFTIREFIAGSNSRLEADKELQIFELYEAYKNVVNDEQDIPLPFEKFYSLAQIILSDFNDIDNYLGDVNSLYSYLKEAESIEKTFQYLEEEKVRFLKNFWRSFSVEKLSYQKEKFIVLWKRLPEIYKNFHQQLATKNLINGAQLSRRLAEEKHDRVNFESRWNCLSIVGFNAFTKAEEKIMQRWNKNNNALFYWDADAHYVEDKMQEAGYFIRKNMQQLGLHNALGKIPAYLNNPQREIEMIGVPGFAAQAKLLPQLFNGLLNQSPAPDSVAIILPDEKMLLPVLQSLPENAGSVNITMGYPLLQSAVYSLIELWCNIQEDIAKKETVYFRFAKAFLQHPLSGVQAKEANELQSQLTTNQFVQVPLRLVKNCSSLSDYFFEKINSGNDFFERLQQLLISIMEMQQGNKQLESFTSALLQQAWQCLHRLQQLCDSFHHELNISFLTHLIKQSLGSIRVPLEGDPLEGIQIMGLLESRGLDFKNIVLLSVNEGILPKTDSAVTFIPDSIRRAFSLPVKEMRDAITAYIFYRLLQRSEKIKMLYNSVISEDNSGECSRYIAQLKYETNCSITEKIMAVTVKAQLNKEIVIPKTISVLQKMQEKISPYKALSASAINSYLYCRLKFYFEKIAGLKEPEEPVEEVDAALFGSLFHDTMEQVYQTHRTEKNRAPVTEKDIEAYLQRLDEMTNKGFAMRLYKDINHPLQLSGNLAVVKEIVKEYARMTLNFDKHYAPFEIIELENKQDYKTAIEINTAAGKKQISLYGIIDRIDFKDGLYRIVDYKTGSREEIKFLSFDQLFERDNDGNNKAVLQTLLYSLIFQKRFPHRTSFEPALYILRKMNEKNYATQHEDKSRNIKIDQHSMQEYLSGFEKKLETLLAELFDPGIPFDQTIDNTKCIICCYNGICRKA